MFKSNGNMNIDDSSKKESAKRQYNRVFGRTFKSFNIKCLSKEGKRI